MTSITFWFEGARRSRTVIFNVLLAILGALELMSSSLTELFGSRTSAAVMILGCITNIVLRTVTRGGLGDRVYDREPPAEAGQDNG